MSRMSARYVAQKVRMNTALVYDLLNSMELSQKTSLEIGH